jgi:hypothetical protein
MLDVKTGHTFFGTSGLSENWCSAHSLTGHSWQSLSKVRKHRTSVASTRVPAQATCKMQHTSAECRSRLPLHEWVCIPTDTPTVWAERHPRSMHLMTRLIARQEARYPNARECDRVNKIKVNINVNTHPSNSCQNPAEPASIARKT